MPSLLLFGVALALAACGGDDGTTTSAGGGQPAENEASGGRARPVSAGDLEHSMEAELPAFLQRPDSELRRVAVRELGDSVSLGLRSGTAECRPGAETPAISNPEKVPFACNVTVQANAGGVTEEVILGFVVLDLEGHCWTAANERVAATTSPPVLFPRRVALAAPNRIRGCV